MYEPSVPLKGAFGGKTSNDVSPKATTSHIPDHINPFFSIGFSSSILSSSEAPAASSSACSPVYLPNRGTTIRSVTHVPIAVNRNTDAAIKNQFIAIFIVSAYAGLIVAAASIVNSPKSTSVPESNKLALNPADTPANAAANPASGCLPKAANMRAPSGGNTTYPASDATLDMTPANTRPIVMNLVGIARTNPRKSALINPVRSATPIPS